ncbi:mechanosensitive ion channel family protein [Demequina lutea]|uniref:Small conductance mechanosensitive channel n=1 Tax=Demequina lutea TaxID=431489 RepID=A0A7Z0CKL4_9MICO|nr:mechanosensitive ion channel family protein [Demequina lutea]NYI41972.1 small conductance mechanosensitive channel [Demequina lutea]
MRTILPLAHSVQFETTIGGRTLSQWTDAIATKAIAVGALLLVGLLVWIIGRLVIRALTRSIETGLPVSKRARKALARAHIDLPVATAQEHYLATLRRQQRAGTIRAVLQSALAVVVLAIVVVTALQMVGVPVAPLLASAGIAGVALGFGAQSLVKDLLAGFFMLIEDQFGVGDIADVGDATGVVEEVGLRSTRLRSLNGTVWFVPNGEIRRVGNMTKMWSRALIEVRMDFETDIDLARAAMLDALAAARAADPDVDAAILSDPEVPGIEDFDYYSVVVRLMVNVSPTTQWTVMRAVRKQMRFIFAERGIRLAMPGDTLYLEDDRPSSKGIARPEPKS